LIVTSNWKNSF